LIKINGFSEHLPLLTTFKEYYKRQHALRNNWRKGWFKRIEFHGHKDFIITCLHFEKENIVAGATNFMINVHSTNDPAVSMD
jgi:F-box and WD-40 domain protein CDC4